MRVKFKNILKSFLLLCLSLSISYSYRIDKSSIDYILNTYAYSYLEPVVKEYIKDYYEETGEVLLTEKNKEDNKPYLNSIFATYLVSENKDNYELIPSVTVTDYSATSTVTSSSNTSSSYDLRNVNGNNYVTSVKNQGNEGLCWAYSINSYLESFLLVRDGISYDFDEHQLDYATALDGSDNPDTIYNNSSVDDSDKPIRTLSSGSSFNKVEDVLLDGLGFANQSWTTDHQEEIDNLDYIEPSDIYSANSLNYQVDKVTHFGIIDFSTASTSTKDSYLNEVKNAITKGGAVINTTSPGGNCSVNVNGNTIVYFDTENTKCKESPHSMHIIGWDDNISYSMCKTSTSSAFSTDVTNCSSDNLITGQGAWLVKNSWGNSYSYVYIAYSSPHSEIYSIDSISSIDYDNFYTFYSNGNNKLEKKVKTKEKITKLKVLYSGDNYETNATLKILNEATDTLATIETNGYGIYSVDLSNKEFYLEDDSKIYISKSKTDSTESEILKLWLHIYTDNVDTTETGIADDSSFSGDVLSNIPYYKVRVSADVRNISTGSTISYRIKDTSGNLLNVDMYSNNNIVFSNKIYDNLYISNSLSQGNYLLEILYNNNILATSNLSITAFVVYTLGDGTKDSPWQIGTPTQLNAIRNNLKDYYILTNDIDLTYDTSNTNGLFYNNGKGWIPINNFNGSFDGKNYTIKGLTSSSGGLFGSVGSTCKNDCVLKNITFDSVNISGGSVVGALGGEVTNYSINTIFVNSGSIKGGVGSIVGGIIGRYLFDTSNTNYYNEFLYNSATISGGISTGGIFGSIIGTGASNSTVSLWNVENLGSVTSNNRAAGILGNFVTSSDSDMGIDTNTKVEIKNAINNGNVSGKKIAGIIYTTDTYINHVILTNVYNLKNSLSISNNSTLNTNVYNMSIYDIVSSSNYANVKNILGTTNWNYEIDGIARVPILNRANFTYTTNTLDSISLKNGDIINLNNYIEPLSSLNNIEIEGDNNYIEYNTSSKIITTKQVGLINIKIKSLYDGYIKDISLNIESPITEYYIEFDSNGGDGTMDIQTVSYNTKVNLNANTFTKENYRLLKWNTLSDGTGISYKDKEEIYNLATSEKQTIKLYAIWKEKQDVDIYYDVDEENKFVYIFENTLYNNYIDNIVINNNAYTVSLYNLNNKDITSNDIVGTGSTMIIYQNNVENDSYTNVILGDVNGDGKIDISDVAKIYGYVMSVINTDKLLSLASDINSDSRTDISDVAKIYNKIMKEG